MGVYRSWHEFCCVDVMYFVHTILKSALRVTCTRLVLWVDGWIGAERLPSQGALLAVSES